jgi:hypothetical protein
MKRPILVVLLLLAGLILFWLASSDEREPSPAPSSEKHLEDQGKEATSQPAIAERELIEEQRQNGASRGEIQETAVEPATPWIVSILAMHGHSEPLAGAELQVSLHRGTNREGDLLHTKTVTADSEGRVQWALEAPGETVTVRATGEKEDCKVYGAEATVLEGRQPPLLEVRFYAMDATVEGSVRSEDGAPIAEARVFTAWHSTLTDAEGVYSLQAGSQMGEVAVYAVSSGFAQCRAVANLQGPGATVRADFILVAEFTMGGRVVDERGNPIFAAEAKTAHAYENIATSDERGCFVLRHLDPRREQIYLYVRKEGYVAMQTTVESEGEHTDLGDLELSRGLRVEGVVVDDRGQPCESAQLYIGRSPNTVDRLDQVSKADGSFAFDHVGAGEKTLVTSLDGFAQDRRKVFLPEGESAVTGLVIQLFPGQFIGGVSIDTESHALPGVYFSVRHEERYTNHRGRSDEHGRFRVEDLPQKQVQLEFYGEGILRKLVPVKDFNHEELKVVLEKSALLAGRVIDGVTGEPLEDFTIRIVQADQLPDGRPGGGYSASWGREGHRFTGTGGYWDTARENLMSGEVHGIEARAGGYAPSRLGHVVAQVDPDPDEYTIRMYPGSVLAGQVLGADGRPAAGARLVLLAAADPRMHVPDEPYDAGLALTQEDGSFEIQNASSGPGKLLVQPTDGPIHVDGPFEIPIGGRIDRIIHLLGSGRIDGFLLDASGVPQGGEEIHLSTANEDGRPGFSREYRTAADGSFSFENLSDGRYQVTHVEHIEGKKVSALSSMIRVEDGDWLEVTLKPDGKYQVRGILECEDGGSPPPIAAVSLLVQSPEEDRREGTIWIRGGVARAGEFRISGVPAGLYRAMVFDQTRGRSLTGSAAVEIRDQDVEVTVVLKEFQFRR